MLRLNLGCGTQIGKDWLNVDYSLGARIRKTPIIGTILKRFFKHSWDKRISLHNLTKKFPWKDATVDAIYTSHTLEHFSKAQGMVFLKECHRVSKKDGIIRIVVPNLEYMIGLYNNGEISAEDFCDRIMVTYESPKGLIASIMAPYATIPHIHKCMYDHAALVKVLNELGFQATQKAGFESDITDIRDIEIEQRVTNAVIVEGKKL